MWYHCQRYLSLWRRHLVEKKQSTLRQLILTTSAAAVQERALQKTIAQLSDSKLSDLPLAQQRALTKLCFTTAMPQQQQKVVFGSSLEHVREHYPDWPLDTFISPFDMSTTQLQKLLPHLVKRAGAKRKANIDKAVQNSKAIKTEYKQLALNIIATAFKEASQTCAPAGEQSPQATALPALALYARALLHVDVKRLSK